MATETVDSGNRCEYIIDQSENLYRDLRLVLYNRIVRWFEAIPLPQEQSSHPNPIVRKAEILTTNEQRVDKWIESSIRRLCPEELELWMCLHYREIEVRHCLGQVH